MGAKKDREYVLVRRQAGGCDYTVGCGVAVDTVEASCPQEALDRLAARLGWGPEFCPEDLDSLEILEVASSDGGEVFKRWRQRMAGLQEDAKRRRKEAQERAEYERLRGKFGS